MEMVASEPSMEEILSSIKRIIADGSDRPNAPKTAKRRGPVRVEMQDTPEASAVEDVSAEEQPDDESAVLELTDRLRDDSAETAAAPTAINADAIVSDRSAEAARQSLHHLSSLLIKPREGESNTLEGLVREMLRPMLKDWLDAQLPSVVEDLVKKEIDRIVGRLG